MATRLLDRLKRSLFKEPQGAEPKEEGAEPKGGKAGLTEGGAWPNGKGAEPKEVGWEAELEEEEEECVTERLGGTLCFHGDGGGGGGGEDVADGDGSGADSDSDFLGESTEEGTGSTAPPSVENLQFEVTDASVVQDGASRYVLYTLLVFLSGGSDKSPAVISRRYSDFQRLHATLRRYHGDHMDRVCFPRKKLRRNFAAETIAKRSRGFEQFLAHLCSLAALRGAPCVRRFFYLPDLHTAQLLIRVGRYQEALGPLLNAKRLQHKLGWARYHDNRAQAPPPASSHWLYTLVGLASSFQEVEQLEEAWLHCDHALRVLTPTEEDKPRPLDDKPLSLEDKTLPPDTKPRPLDEKTLSLEDKTLPLDTKPRPLYDKPLSLDDKPLSLDKPRPLDDKPLSLEDKLHSLGDKPRPLDDKPLSLGDKPRPLDEKPLSLGDKPRPLDDKPLSLDNKPRPLDDKPLSLDKPRLLCVDRPHPLLLPLLRAVVRLSWQTGRDKRQWEELLRLVEGKWAEPKNEPTIREFLIKHNLEDSEG